MLYDSKYSVLGEIRTVTVLMGKPLRHHEDVDSESHRVNYRLDLKVS